MSMSALCIRRALPRSADASVDRARDALTGDGRKLVDLRRLHALRFGAVQDRLGKRMLAPNLESCREAQHLVLVKPGAVSTPVSVGLPSVRVPVLSTTSVSTEARRSSAAALRTSTPACAPRPVATMIEIGVASPSAQGQAMMSTLTAATSA